MRFFRETVCGARRQILRRARMKAVRLLEYGGQLVFKRCTDAGDRT